MHDSDLKLSGGCVVKRKYVAVWQNPFLVTKGGDCFSVEGGAQSFCPSKNHYFTESLPNNQEYIYYLNKGRSFLLSESHGSPNHLKS